MALVAGKKSIPTPRPVRKMTATQAPASHSQRRVLVSPAGFQLSGFGYRLLRNCLLDRIDPGLFTPDPVEHLRLIGSWGLSSYESRGGGEWLSRRRKIKKTAVHSAS